MSKKKKILIIAVILLFLVIATKLEYVYDVFRKSDGEYLGQALSLDTDLYGLITYFGVEDKGFSLVRHAYKEDVVTKKRLTYKIKIKI